MQYVYSIEKQGSNKTYTDSKEFIIRVRFALNQGEKITAVEKLNIVRLTTFQSKIFWG